MTEQKRQARHLEESTVDSTLIALVRVEADEAI
jgi:hypothetical protein